MELTILTLTGIIILLLYFYHKLTNVHDYWQKLGIPIVGRPLPFFGNVAPVFFFRQHVMDLLRDFYNNTKGHSMAGFYYHNEPCLMLRDPELVQKVMVTHFTSFSDNDLRLENDEEPILSKNPFFTSGSAWKLGRARLSSASTTNKLKIFSNRILRVLDDFIEYSRRNVNENGGLWVIEGKDYFTDFTAELLANLGFGRNGNCFEKRNDSISIKALAQMVLGGSWENKLRMVILMRLPILMPLLRMSFFPRKFVNQFGKLIDEELKNRRENGHTADTFVQLMIEQEAKNLNDEEQIKQEVSSHMMSFFIDLYDTTSSTLAFLFYQLASNEAIQKRVRREIQSVVGDSAENLTSEILGNLVYTEQVIHESLRINPTVGQFVKFCTEKYDLVGSDGLSCLLEPNTRIFIPVEGLHRESEIWEEPDKYDPDRFARLDVDERLRMTYFGFGAGPRSCPGKRLSLVLIKMTLCKLLTKFTFELSPRIRVPIELDKFLFLRVPKDGVWLRLRLLESR